MKNLDLGPGMARYDRLMRRYEAKGGNPHSFDCWRFAELYPRLVRSLKWSAVASTSEAGAFIRDWIYGYRGVMGAEVWSHAGVTGAEWMRHARRCWSLHLRNRRDA